MVSPGLTCVIRCSDCTVVVLAAGGSGIEVILAADVADVETALVIVGGVNDLVIVGVDGTITDLVMVDGTITDLVIVGGVITVLIIVGGA